MTWPTFGKKELILVLALVAAGSFLRLYHLPQTLLFLGDQGRDAIIAKRILKDRDIALIGPVTSVGNMYLGPFYYYFMVPFLAFSYPDPVGPAYGVAIVNCLSLLAMYLVVRDIFGRRVGMMGLFIYSFMPLAIQLSRYSWNPNLGAPVSILLFWAVHSWYQTRRLKYALLTGLFFGILIQLHYVALTTLAVISGAWLVALLRTKKHRNSIVLQGLAMTGVFLILLSPLVAFDFRHDNLISKRFVEFFTTSPQPVKTSSQLPTPIREIEGRTYRVLSQLVSGTQNSRVDLYLSIFGLMFIGLLILNKKIAASERVGFGLMLGWLGSTIIGIAFYSSSIFDHYLSYCMPMVALFWAYILNKLWQTKLTKPIFLGLGIYFAIVLYQGILAIPFSGKGTVRYEETVKKTMPYVTSPYNIALLGSNGDYQGMNYRYFYEVSGNPPLSTDEYQDLSTLVIIDELNMGNPFSVPAYEIQAPGLTQLKTTIDVVDGPVVYIYE